MAAAAPRVKVKKKPPEKPTKEDLLALRSIIGRGQITTHRYLPQNDGWIVLVQSVQHAQKMLDNTFREEINRIGLEIDLPPELKAQHTIVVKKLDFLIYDYSKKEIIEEIEEQNQARQQVEDIYLMQKHDIIKIKFRNIELAQKIKQNGIYIYSNFYPSTQIEDDRYTKINQCMSCYSYNHSKAQCPNKEKEKICSECSNFCDYKFLREMTNEALPSSNFSQLSIARQPLSGFIISTALKHYIY